MSALLPDHTTAPHHSTALLDARLDFSPERTILRLHGRVDESVVDDLDSLLEAACHSSPASVVVDLNFTHHVDASVVSAIVAFRRRVPATNVTIDVTDLPGPRLMAMLAEVFEPRPSGAPAS